ncbi:hypothetical protein HY500_02095 [Candidatus Woesearchaeota archaeon]|nr:hypothetical protein [Candidatus Woesearchaeota archaeon]
MKKALSIFIIAIFLISYIPVNAQTSGPNVCCVKNKNGEYCSYTKSENCELENFDVNNKVGIKKSDFACSQLNICNPVCCINKEGTCSEKISTAQCVDQGGIATIASECSAVPQCQKGACVINGQCSYPITQEECTRARNLYNTETIFDIEVKSANECSEKYSLQEGCCVTTPSCGRKNSKECADVKGEFKVGMLCSNPDLAGVCPGVKKEASKQCEKEDVYWFDSRENKENVVGIPYDGFIHDLELNKRGREGNCDFREGTICGQDNSGQNACVNVNCNVGDTFVSNGFVQYSFEEGKSSPERISTTQADLSGRDIRYNGESWCMTNTNSDPNKPGTIHYVYSCQLGKIVVNSCNTFRETICDSQSKNIDVGGKSIEIENAACIKNKWETCNQCGEGWNNKCDSKECYKLGGSKDPEKSFCVFKGDGIDECLPKYPPGFDFTGGFELDKVPSSKYSFENTCNTCGAGGTNTCDRNECTYLGDCGNFKEGLSTLEGAFLGGSAAATIFLGGYYIPQNILPGTLKEIFTLGAAETAKAAGGATIKGVIKDKVIDAALITILNSIVPTKKTPDGKDVVEHEGKTYVKSGDDYNEFAPEG